MLIQKRTMQLLDGKKTSEEIKEEIAREVEKIRQSGGKIPHLAAVLVGDDAASETYVNAKVKACEKVGFKSSLFRFRIPFQRKSCYRKLTS